MKIRKLVPRLCETCGRDFMGRADSPGRVCSQLCRARMGGFACIGISKNYGNTHRRKGALPVSRPSCLIAARRWSLANPEKRRAEYTALWAIKNGLLVRQPCEQCGNPKTHAHHEDYSQPLLVAWLCSRHHRRRHIEMAGKVDHALPHSV